MILGSSSPRRKEILQYFTLPFSVQAPDFDEDSHPLMDDPKAYSMALATKKAESLSHHCKDELILCADTVVFCEGRIYNKPKDKVEAKHFLMQLSGRWHEVITSLCIKQKDKQVAKSEVTRILFAPLNEEKIEHYLSHFAFLDKAGGYAIQQSGSIIVEKIDGCFYNVMGLPIQTLASLLLEFEINLWQHLKIF